VETSRWEQVKGQGQRDHKVELKEKIISREANIGVIGLGYVGLPLIIEFVKAGFCVTGFDIDTGKVSALKSGRSYIKHISSESIEGILPRFEPTTDFSKLSMMDAIVICVPTPLNKNREPDMSYVFDTTRSIAKYLRKGQLISLESTTYPGTTDQDVRAILEETGLKAGTDFYLAFSPEREDPNNKDFNTRTIPKVVGGINADSLEVAKAMYDQIVDRTVPVSCTRVAEATKILENTFRAVNIALVNELKVTFMKMGIDIWEVIEAAKTKPFGFMPFYPGPGLGGHCIPIDPFYLTWKAREYGVSTRFIELAGEINTSMPDFVVQRVMEALNEVGKPLKGAKVLMLGLAYKANVDDHRESPSFHLMEKLEEKGAKVSYNDPYIPVIGATREFPQYAGKKSERVSDDYDAVLIATAHDEYKAIDFSGFKCVIVDTRNILKNGRAVKA